MTINDDEIAQLADPGRDQYFLSSPRKLELLVKAAAIRHTDHVVEIGAGIGTVARVLPKSASLTLIELDSRFTDLLKMNAPHATVIQGDALSIIQDIPCDVLLSNLPTVVTQDLIPILPKLSFRTAIITASNNCDFGILEPQFMKELVASIGGHDFRPPQPSHSLLMKLTRKSS